MRIVQVTNIMSHHQLPLARGIAELVGKGNFRFVTTQATDEERRAMGWNPEENDPWILRAGEDEADRAHFEHWWNNADIVLCGDRLLEKINNRLAHGKPVFYMSERWWKPPIGSARLFHPGFARMAYRFRQLAASPYFHFLPIGDYSAEDMKRIASFKSRRWRWGYFTALPDPLPQRGNDLQGFRVMWAGRMLGWKRVDTLIKGFSRLLDERPDATLTLVGDGPEREKLANLARRQLAPGSYLFLPPQPVSVILEMMRQHHVYVLPSNAYEGWGAVVNEAMSEGCAVIASDTAGAAKSMIKHMANGLLFHAGEWNKLSELLILVNRDETLRLKLAREGQQTIAECWSPDLAAHRFVSFCEAMLGGNPLPVFESGPMSPL